MPPQRVEILFSKPLSHDVTIEFTDKEGTATSKLTSVSVYECSDCMIMQEARTTSLNRIMSWLQLGGLVFVYIIQ